MPRVMQVLLQRLTMLIWKLSTWVNMHCERVNMQHDCLDMQFEHDCIKNDCVDMQFDGVALQNNSVVRRNVCVEMQNDSVEDEHQRQSINNKFAHIKKWKMGSLFFIFTISFPEFEFQKVQKLFFLS